ncbi:MAG: endonuclease/exonuclease/phosphatase family protein, partial [Candidatus Thiodiazotropha endolucinida]|nr:endonuclease/exonuclease/phosphatase family protein [Candidatus Thiodiazotropha taylori]MCW4343673.1 endonuclease/exonuclease/phosphatase family protein [Candidatus Thiodiazotropha endolucinida]
MDVHSNPGPDSNETHSLDIIHLNTRSIRNKLDYLSNVVDSFQIACFSETHLDADINSNNLTLEGFDEPLRKDRTRNGGGIMIYISSLLQYNRRHDLESPQIETIWVEIKLKDRNLLLCCLYRSDFTASQSVFITDIQNSIEIALDYTPHVILTGDINIDFINLTNSQLRDCLSIFNLRNVLNEPTRVNANSATLIDPVIVSDVCTVLDSGTLSVDEFISDHKATYVSLQINITISMSYYREVWNYKNVDTERLNQLIGTHDWDSVMNENCSVDEACVNFTDIFLKFCKECIPCRKVLIRQNDKPWFNSELRFNLRI